MRSMRLPPAGPLFRRDGLPLRPCELRLSPVFPGRCVDVVGAGLVECRRTACREERHEQSTYFEISVFHRVSELLCGYIFNENRTGFIADESLSHKSSNKIGKYIERVKIEIRIFFCSENAFFAKNSYICTPNYRPKGW